MPLLWETREGHVLPVEHMTDAHLANAILYVRRRLREGLDEEAAGWGVLCALQGEAARDFCEYSLNVLQEDLATVRGALRALERERERRGRFTGEVEKDEGRAGALDDAARRLAMLMEGDRK